MKLEMSFFFTLEKNILINFVMLIKLLASSQSKLIRLSLTCFSFLKLLSVKWPKKKKGSRMKSDVKRTFPQKWDVTRFDYRKILQYKENNSLKGRHTTFLKKNMPCALRRYRPMVYTLCYTHRIHNFWS